MRSQSDKLLSIYLNELQGINLTRILDSDEFYQKQYLDSILPAKKVTVFHNSIVNAKIIVDIGFGGGFPIIPLAQLYTEKMFFGFEARNKKVEAVKKICNLLNLSNVDLFHERLENLFFTKESVLTFKAVGTVDKFLPMLNCEAGVKIFFYKAKNFYDDETLIPNKAFDLICNEEISIPGSEEITRYLIGYQANVPRGTKKQKKLI